MTEADSQAQDHQKTSANKSSIHQFYYHESYLMLYKVLHITLESHMKQSVSLLCRSFQSYNNSVTKFHLLSAYYALGSEQIGTVHVFLLSSQLVFTYPELLKRFSQMSLFLISSCLDSGWNVCFAFLPSLLFIFQCFHQLVLPEYAWWLLSQRNHWKNSVILVRYVGEEKKKNMLFQHNNFFQLHTLQLFSSYIYIFI